MEETTQDGNSAGSLAGESQTEAKSGDPERRSPMLTQMAIIGTIAGLFIGTGNITVFPMSVLEYGGFYFVGAHLILVVFFGLPITFFELLIGQLTGKGTIAVYGTYCRAAKGVGLTIFLNAIMLMALYLSTDRDSPGINSRIVVSAIRDNDQLFSCGNKWNTQDCVSLYESIRKCPKGNSKHQMAYINGSCTMFTNDRELYDTIDELSHYLVASTSYQFDIYHFLTTFSILILPLNLLFFDVKFTFYSFGGIFAVLFILYLIILILMATMIDFRVSFDYLWHRTHYANLFNPSGLNTLVSGVLWTLSIKGILAPIGPFLKPKDPTFMLVFIPIILDFAVSFSSVALLAGVLSGLANSSPASGYLYKSAFGGTHGLIMYSQLLVSYINGPYAVILFSLTKLVGYVGKMSYIVLSLKSVFQDHFPNNYKMRILSLSAFVLFNCIIVLMASFPETHGILKSAFEVSADSISNRISYFAGILICIRVYGEIDFGINLAEIYPKVGRSTMQISRDTDNSKIRRFFGVTKRRLFNLRRYFSPSGPVMFFCWKHVLPFILVISQSFCYVDAWKVIRVRPKSSLLPMSFVLIAPAYAIAIIIKQRISKKPIFEVFLPSEDHPSYKTIIADYKKKAY